MSAPPKTVLRATPEEAEAIRCAVRDVDVKQLGADCVVAGAEHVAGLTALLEDPRVSGPIYDLPRPITPTTIDAWIEDALRLRACGEALLVVRLDAAGAVYSYSRFAIWPEFASAEIAGGFRAELQNAGAGKAGAARSFDWMFDALKVRLICVTAALDNVRSAHVIEAAGFRRMGEREGVRPDGSIRRSLYWELAREDWLAQRAES